MIFVDSNVPMYMVGGPHPNKDRVEALLDQLRAGGEELVTDTEVYQEILHRYMSIRRPGMIDPAFEKLDSIVGEVFTFDMPEVRYARELLRSVPGISARDAIHVAVMRRKRITRILSFDRGLDACPGIERIS